MKRTILIFLLLISALSIKVAKAHNIQISNVTLPTILQNTSNQSRQICFNVAWKNSWRTNTLEANWDAAWIFVKYRKKWSNVWNHATINYVDGTAANDGHQEPAGATITTPSDGKGVFLYRSAANIGIGDVNFTDARIRWNYGVDGLADYDSVEVCVFGIDMVYIPMGSFYIGDGNGTNEAVNAFHVTNNAYTLITNALTSNITVDVNGYDDNTLEVTGIGIHGLNGLDANNDGVIDNPNFPTGYKAFYIMKYEITQYQYVEFLNKLTRAQQVNNAWYNTLNIYINSNTVTPINRNGIRVINEPGGNDPRTYACDLNNNGVYNEIDDGLYIANNFMNYADGAAFSDWAGLRPMTELEYEKACRGPLIPVLNEAAWGNTNLFQATVITNAGRPDELVNAGKNINYNNVLLGPVRVGCFSNVGNTRESSGGTFYGVMEMSGNLRERAVTLGVANGRNFTGLHGDGNLDVNGFANVANWPPTNSLGIGIRGGAHQTSINECMVSDRTYAAWNDGGGRTLGNGFRAARTAP